MLKKLDQYKACPDDDQVQSQQPQPSLPDIPEQRHTQQRQHRRNRRHREGKGQEPVLPVLHAHIEQECRQAGKIDRQEDHRPEPREQQRQQHPDPGQRQAHHHIAGPADLMVLVQAKDQAGQRHAEHDHRQQPHQQRPSMPFLFRQPVRIQGPLFTLLPARKHDRRMAQRAFRRAFLQFDSAIYAIHPLHPLPNLRAAARGELLSISTGIPSSTSRENTSRSSSDSSMFRIMLI